MENGKRSSKQLGACLIIVSTIVIFLLLFLLLSFNANRVYEDEIFINNGDYYTLEYQASYNINDEISGKLEYEVANSKADLDEILQRFHSGNKTFDEKFFEDKKIVVIYGGVGARVESLETESTSVSALLYEHCPFGTADTMYDFDSFLIPIEKTVENYDIEMTCYPGIIY